MIRNIIRYLGLALVIIGIVLVMKNLFSTDNGEWNSKSLKDAINAKSYYEANIKLLDEETNDYIIGSEFVLKNDKKEVIDKWTSEDEKHTVIKLEEGTYILEQTKVAEGYEDDKKTITFKITDDNKEIVVYNTAIVEKVNETSSEVNVESTASFKNHFVTIVAGIIVLIGLGMVLFPNKKFNK